MKNQIRKEVSSSWDIFNRLPKDKCSADEAVRRIEAIEAVKADVPLMKAIYTLKKEEIYGKKS